MNDDMRIRYKRGEVSVCIDKGIFNRWESGFITTDRAAFELSRSVEQEISQEQFIINANWLGYHRKLDQFKIGGE